MIMGDRAMDGAPLRYDFWGGDYVLGPKKFGHGSAVSLQ